jgi:hypothetical protein
MQEPRSRIYLEPLSVSAHLPDFHLMWSDPGSLIWSCVPASASTTHVSPMTARSGTQPPKKSMEESRERMMK